MQLQAVLPIIFGMKGPFPIIFGEMQAGSPAISVNNQKALSILFIL